MNPTIRKVIATISVVGFFVSLLDVAWWNASIGFNKLIEQSPYLFTSIPEPWPQHQLESVRCPDKVARGKSTTVTAAMPYSGLGTDYSVTFWVDAMLDDETSSQQPLCEEIISVPPGKTAEASCTITAPSRDLLLTVIVQVSPDKEMSLAQKMGSGTHQGMCRIIVGSFSTDYFSNPWIGFVLTGTITMFTLWALASWKTIQLPPLLTMATVTTVTLMWIPAVGWGILHLENDFIFWVAVTAPYIAFVLAAAWLTFGIRLYNTTYKRVMRASKE